MPLPPSSRKLIIFDCDGVLVDSEHISSQALIDSLCEQQIEIQLEDAMQRFRGRNLVECFAEIEAQIGQRLPPDFESRFRARRSEYFEVRLRPIAGVNAALGQIPHAKCVASNGPLSMIQRNLQLAGLDAALAGGFQVLAFGQQIFSSSRVTSFQEMSTLPELVEQVFENRQACF